MNSSNRSMPIKASARGFGRVALVVVLVALVVAGWGLVSRERAEARLRAHTEKQIARTVTTISATRSDTSIDLSLPGNVVARVEASIFARTDGYLARLHVDIGTTVTAGQLLAEIDAPELDQQLREGGAEVAAAEAAAALAQTTAERWLALGASHTVSRQQVDEQQSAAQASAARLNAARASLQRLQELSAFKRIVAPFDGIVTVRNTDIGQLISANGTGEELFRIADTSRLRVFVRVPQVYVATMTPGLVARLGFPDRPGAEYEARLVRSANALDAASRTLLVELDVDNRHHELLSGTYVDVHFQLPGSSKLRLPANTLLFRAAGPHVATVGEDNRVLLKPVTLGRDFGNELEILSGVDATDRVILSPPDSLSDHEAVRIVNGAGTTDHPP